MRTRRRQSRALQAGPGRPQPTAEFFCSTQVFIRNLLLDQKSSSAYRNHQLLSRGQEGSAISAEATFGRMYATPEETAMSFIRVVPNADKKRMAVPEDLNRETYAPPRTQLRRK